MLSRVPRIIAMRQEAHGEEIRRALITLPEPPVAQIGGVYGLMIDWWRRGGPYPVGRVFGTFRHG